ncbi:MAG: methyltransferase family protein [bacterium]
MKKTTFFCFDMINKCLALLFIAITAIYYLVMSKAIPKTKSIMSTILHSNQSILVTIGSKIHQFRITMTDSKTPYGTLIIITTAILLVLFLYGLINKKFQQLLIDRIFPILFFLTLAIKALWGMRTRIGAKKTLLVNLNILNSFLAISFMFLTIISYILRSEAMHRAHGFWEKVYPLMVVGWHLIGTYILLRYTQFTYVSRIHIPWFYITIMGWIMSIVGVTIDVAAMWQIRKSFSIMVEVRELVTSGIYGYIRHPLYVGEILHVFGIALLFNNKEAFIFFLMVCVVQTQRALLEEKKLAFSTSEYADYRKKAGFYLPKLGRKT